MFSCIHREEMLIPQEDNFNCKEVLLVKKPGKTRDISELPRDI